MRITVSIPIVYDRKYKLFVASRRRRFNLVMTQWSNNNIYARSLARDRWKQ